MSGLLFRGVLDAPEGKPLADRAIAATPRRLLDDLVGQPGGLADKIKRSFPVEIPVDRGEVRKGRRLGE